MTWLREIVDLCQAGSAEGILIFVLWTKVFLLNEFTRNFAVWSSVSSWDRVCI